jgi:hypothetical protein
MLGFASTSPRNVVRQISLLAQVIQSGQRLKVDPKRRRQRLNCRLMVPCLAAAP